MAREDDVTTLSRSLFFLFRSVPLSDYTVGYGVCVRVLLRWEHHLNFAVLCDNGYGRYIEIYINNTICPHQHQNNSIMYLFIEYADT